MNPIASVESKLVHKYIRMQELSHYRRTLTKTETIILVLSSDSGVLQLSGTSLMPVRNPL